MEFLINPVNAGVGNQNSHFISGPLANFSFQGHVILLGKVFIIHHLTLYILHG